MGDIWFGGREGRIKAKSVLGRTRFDFKQLRTIINHKKNTMFHYIYGKNKNHTKLFFYNPFSKTRVIPNAEKYDET